MSAINPECQQGKHDNCDGRAIDNTTDEITGCDCQCHTTTVEIQPDLSAFSEVFAADHDQTEWERTAAELEATLGSGATAAAQTGQLRTWLRTHGWHRSGDCEAQML